MSRSMTIRFATDDVRDLSDGQLPVEVWVVRDYGFGDVRERHFATATKPHRVDHHVRRAARGLSFGCTKHVEVRTPKARQAEGGAA